MPQKIDNSTQFNSYTEDSDELDSKCMKKIKYTRNNGRQINSNEVPKHELSKTETMLLQVIIS